MSGDLCTCGASFRLAEDYRDHLPCPGSETEQLRARVAYLEKGLQGILSSEEGVKHRMQSFSLLNQISALLDGSAK